MTRKTENEKKFEQWCKQNGGEHEIIADVSRCEHPVDSLIKFEDPAFERQQGSVVVPFSDADNDRDFIMYKPGFVGPNGFEDIETSGDTITFYDRQEYQFAEIQFGDEGFNKLDEGEY